MSASDRSVLVVDDSRQDLTLIREAFREIAASVALTEVRSADAAIAYLEGLQAQGAEGLLAAPRLILLDIQMPERSGFSFLTWLRGQPAEWHRVPVVILTTSHNFVEIRKAYDLGANSFLVKPTGFGELVVAMRQVASYWLDRNQLG